MIKCVVSIDMVEEGKALADRPHIVISTPGRLADHINTGTNFSLKKLRFLVTVFHRISLNCILVQHFPLIVLLSLLL